MKKSLLFALCMTAVPCAFAAVGDQFEIDGVTYEVTGTNTVAVAKANSKQTSFTLTESVTNPADNSTYTLTAIGEQAFKWCDATTLTLPNSVTEIGQEAFASSKLVSIELGTGVKTIGRYAFSSSALASITLPEGLETIGGSAFFTCKFSSINFPSTLREVGESAFYKVPLTSVNVPAGVTFGRKIFLQCTKLASVNIAEGVTVITPGMFQSCSALTEITLPTTIESIGEDALLETGITSITIPAATKEIGFSAFSAPNLETITVDPANTAFTMVGDALYSADKSLLYAYPAKSKITEITLDPACVGICNAAFWKSGVTKVITNSKLRAIDEYAFCFSTALKEFSFPASLVLIGTEAFASTGLTEVVLPKALPEIQQAVFAGCESLKTVTISASVNYIDIRAFWGCKALATVNCLAMTPPVLEDCYEDYERQFYNVPSSCKLHVPAAALDAYKSNSNWKAEFSVSNIIGDLASAFVPTAITPAEDSSVSSFEGLELTFSETPTIVKTTPDVKVVCGSLVAGVPVGTTVSVDGWRIVKGSDNQSLKVYPEDYDGFTAPFNMESGKDYYVTIPAGVIKNAAGDLNEAITIHYAGAWEKPSVKLISVDPAEDSQPDRIDCLTFTFAEPVAVVTAMLYNITTTIGNLVDGKPTGEAGPEDDWCIVYGKDKGTVVAIFPSDYDMYTVPIPVKSGTTVFIQLPAGLFRLSSSYSTVSEAMTLAYTKETSSIEDIEAALGTPAEIYTLDGIKVNEMQPGRIYIVRQGNKVTKTIVR